MALSIVNNGASLTAQQNMERVNSNLSQSLERLSSGLKVNRGADGPSSLVISEQQRAQTQGLSVQISQVGRTAAAVQTGDDALHSISSLLARARSLALDSANLGVNDQDALAANAAEVANALDSIQNIATTTQFGGQHLLDGSASDGLSAANAAPGAPNVSIPSATLAALGLDKLTFTVPGINDVGERTQQTVEMTLQEALNYQPRPDGPQLDRQTVDQAVVSTIDRAISTISSSRTSLGAFQSNVLEASVSNLQAALRSATSSEATARDADFSRAVSEYTRNHTMVQAGQTASVSGNPGSSLVQSLLRG